MTGFRRDALCQEMGMDMETEKGMQTGMETRIPSAYLQHASCDFYVVQLVPVVGASVLLKPAPAVGQAVGSTPK